MANRKLVSSMGDLKMYETSPHRYTIDFEDRCIKSNLDQDSALRYWSILLKEYGYERPLSEEILRRSDVRAPSSERYSYKKLEKQGYDVGPETNRIPTHVLYPMEGAFKNKDKRSYFNEPNIDTNKRLSLRGLSSRILSTKDLEDLEEEEEINRAFFNRGIR